MSNFFKKSNWTIGLLVFFNAFAAAPFSDPTQPPAAVQQTRRSRSAAPALRPLELQAILHAAGRRVAIINGKRVHEDDVVASATVVEIEKNHVSLIRDGKRIELSLTHKRIKKTQSSKTRSTARDEATEGISK